MKGLLILKEGKTAAFRARQLLLRSGTERRKQGNIKNYVNHILRQSKIVTIS